MEHWAKMCYDDQIHYQDQSQIHLLDRPCFVYFRFRQVFVHFRQTFTSSKVTIETLNTGAK